MARAQKTQLQHPKDITWFRELGIKDVPLVGGKGALAHITERYIN
ncbi:MAG TPA: hypothetical protein VJC16_01515 [Candidatus Nanoarchaeia archaeon]|nr:hypothetical protein [Candidatus Nanoarchaeia archaeon]